MSEGPRINVFGKRTTVIEFEDGDYAGVRVTCRASVSVETFAGFVRINAGLGDEEAFALLKDFGDRILIDWNVNGADDLPLPANGEGLQKVPLDFALAVLSRWSDAITVPSAPLGAGSPSGAPPRAPSVPMVALSESPLN